MKRIGMIVWLFCFTAGHVVAGLRVIRVEPSQTFEKQVAGVALEAKNAGKALAASPGSEKGPLIGIEWVSIPGGTFKMGSDNGHPNELPVHKVAVKGFEMSKTEVTVEQYKACMDAGECSKPDEYDYCNWGKTGREKHPINCVNWYQAAAFAEWEGGRLPSEAEWEYAARSAGKNLTYPWGNDEPTCEKAVMNCGRGRRDSTRPVCSKTSGNTEQGLCNMAGNVSEWVQDAYRDSYVGAPQDGSALTGEYNSLRVFRGGSWRYRAEFQRSAFRDFVGPGSRYDGLGFRLARPER